MWHRVALFRQIQVSQSSENNIRGNFSSVWKRTHAGGKCPPGGDMNQNYLDWMWSEACAVLVRAERLHRQLFRPALSVGLGPSWEPPIDILETDIEVLVLVAMPGVNADNVEAVIDDQDLLVTGNRILPSAIRTAVIHRLEIPQGRFERRIRLPAGRYQRVRRSAVDGCLLITLEKAGASHG
jgi:HSP20 family protein